MTVDKEPTENSQNPVKSGGVYDELTELKGSLNTNTDFSVKFTIPTLAGGNSYATISQCNANFRLTAYQFYDASDNPVGDILADLTTETLTASSNNVKITWNNIYTAGGSVVLTFSNAPQGN